MTNNISLINRLIWTCLLAFTSFSLYGTTPTSIFDLMQYQEVLEINLEGDFETIKNNRRSQESQKVTLSFRDAAGQAQVWKIKVALRGQYRRMYCTAMPPMKLNFKKSELKEAGLAKFDDMKLVTQCMEGSDDSKELILKEFLAYKLYNQITDESFRVQLLKITYKDTLTNSTSKSWGFLIEDTAQLRARLGATKPEKKLGFKAEDFDQPAFYKMAIFQYMIGNSDWDTSAGRNFKVFEKNGRFIPVPYDFDFSGVVNASYALPNSNYGMTSIQERIYMGYEEDLANLDETLIFYKEQQSSLKNLIRKFKKLKIAARMEAVTYINDFFDTIDTIVYRSKKKAVVDKVSSTID